MAINTTKSVAKAQETAVKDLEASIKQAAAQLKSEKLVKVSVPRAFEKAIGPTLYLGLQGVSIVLPVDGKDYEVPAPFSALLKDYLDNIQM
jgi:hypothetical protein